MGFIVRFLILVALVAMGVGMGRFPDLNAFGKLMVFSLAVTAPTLYMLPTIEAKLANHPNFMALAMLNLFGGWTAIGWVGALVWAFKRPDHAAVVSTPSPMTWRPLPGEVQNTTPSAAIPASDLKDCPFCAEPIKKAAIKCKHCGSDLKCGKIF